MMLNLIKIVQTNNGPVYINYGSVACVSCVSIFVYLFFILARWCLCLVGYNALSASLVIAVLSGPPQPLASNLVEVSGYISLMSFLQFVDFY